ncbi:hypothetical protein HOLleu_28910 [Holothuria leucospilota]|uniref:Uncharacterized protein n=1 Tax=Holothuria leucospilota TaxID=206669 RepID=A0A9Q1BMS5_HOLLE|nr:hypothetical protein HOLleu_28910 [Holothuria leucospilota]
MMLTKGLYLLTMAVIEATALLCYTKVLLECNSPGPFCDPLLNDQTPINVTECEDSETMCVLVTGVVTAPGGTLMSSAGSCLPAQEGVDVTNGCFGRSVLNEILPSLGQEITEFVNDNNANLTFIEVCVCDEDLCNGSIRVNTGNDCNDSNDSVKPVYLLPVITSAVMMTLILSFN